MTRVAVVIGTGREERQSIHVAHFIANELKNRPESPEIDLIDPKDYLISPFTVPAWVADENAQKWRNKAAEVDAFILVVPEYNHSFSGELKLLLDSAFKEYEGKPVGLVGVSNGQYGGTRALEHLFAMLATFKMYVVPYTVAVGNVTDLTAHGSELKAGEQLITFTQTMLDGLFAHITHN